MIRALVKRPKLSPEIIEFKNLNELYSFVSKTQEVEKSFFNYELDIGMIYVRDGYYSGKNANFCYKGKIYYGIVIFVNYDVFGKVKRISKKQINYVENYLEKNT